MVIERVATDLPVWRCQYESCKAALRGRPRVILVGRFGPGTVTERRCDICGVTTRIEVDADGHVRTSIRLPFAVRERSGQYALGVR